jgi:hypothetical protein
VGICPLLVSSSASSFGWCYQGRKCVSRTIGSRGRCCFHCPSCGVVPVDCSGIDLRICLVWSSVLTVRKVHCILDRVFKAAAKLAGSNPESPGAEGVATSSPTNVPSQLPIRLKLCSFALLPLEFVVILARTIVLVTRRKSVISKIRMTDLPVLNPCSRIFSVPVAGLSTW